MTQSSYWGNYKVKFLYFNKWLETGTRNWRDNTKLCSHKQSSYGYHVMRIRITEPWNTFRRVRKIAKSDYYLRCICPPVCLSALNNSAPTRRIFTKFDMWGFFEPLSIKLKFHSYLTIITGTLHEHLRTFMIIPRLIFLRMRHVSDKSCRDNQNTHFMLNNFFPKIVPFMRYVEKYGRARQATDDNTIRRRKDARIQTHTHNI